MLYFASCGMNTLCNVFILLAWQTIGKDIGVGLSTMNREDSFRLNDPSVLIISVMLSTPFLYKYMVLPPSRKTYTAPSMKTPKFLQSVKHQCLAYSLYLGLAGFLNTYLYSVDQGFLEIAANITKDDTFRSKYSLHSLCFVKIYIRYDYYTPSVLLHTKGSR